MPISDSDLEKLASRQTAGETLDTIMDEANQLFRQIDADEGLKVLFGFFAAGTAARIRKVPHGEVLKNASSQLEHFPI